MMILLWRFLDVYPSIICIIVGSSGLVFLYNCDPYVAVSISLYNCVPYRIRLSKPSGIPLSRNIIWCLSCPRYSSVCHELTDRCPFGIMIITPPSVGGDWRVARGHEATTTQLDLPTNSGATVLQLAEHKGHAGIAGTEQKAGVLLR